MKHELSRLRARVVALQEQRNEFIAKLIHDIRGPLTSIVGFSELLDEDMLEGESAADAIKIIRSNAARLTQLTADLLAMNRAEADELDLEKKPVDLSRLVAEFSGVNVPPGIVIQGDEKRLAAALGNLFDNAEKFSKNGVAPSAALHANNGVATLTIVDSGIGIPSDEIASVGERFFRASNAKKEKLAGTGVGVFIAKAVIEAHGGELSFASNRGTTVTVRLPLAGTGKKSVKLDLPAEEKRYFARALRERGYRVVETDADIVVRSPDEALVLVES